MASSFLRTARAQRPSPSRLPAEIKGDFGGIVLDGNRLHLRVVKHFDEGTHHLTVISNVPVTG